MTKAELIKQLERYPDDAEILLDIENPHQVYSSYLPVNVIHYYGDEENQPNVIILSDGEY